MTNKQPHPTETQINAAITEAATYAGYLWHHTQTNHTTNPNKGTPGPPNYILTHPKTGATFFIHTKHTNNQPTNQQQQWRNALKQHNTHIITTPQNLAQTIETIITAAQPPTTIDKNPQNTIN